MIINEKGLCRAMKAAWKAEGYYTTGNAESISIWAEDWFVQFGTREAPKKALALIVEHMGTLPREAVLLQKSQPAQLVMDAARDMAYWLDMGDREKILSTSVTIGRWRLMQGFETHKCYGIDTDNLDIAESWEIMPALLTNDKAMWMHGDEVAAVSTIDTLYAMEPAWKALETVNLID